MIKTIDDFVEKWNETYKINESVRKAIDLYLTRRKNGEILRISTLEKILGDEKYRIANDLIDDITNVEYHEAKNKAKN